MFFHHYTGPAFTLWQVIITFEEMDDIVCSNSQQPRSTPDSQHYKPFIYFQDNGVLAAWEEEFSRIQKKSSLGTTTSPWSRQDSPRWGLLGTSSRKCCARWSKISTIMIAYRWTSRCITRPGMSGRLVLKLWIAPRYVQGKHTDRQSKESTEKLKWKDRHIPSESLYSSQHEGQFLTRRKASKIINSTLLLLLAITPRRNHLLIIYVI
jgi:hypothetical protein